MYRFRYLLGLEHSKCTRVAWRVGGKWPISYYVSDNEHHSYSFSKSKSFYPLMLIDHSKEAENDQLSNGYSLNAPSGALRALFFCSLTWRWKIYVKVTPNQSSRTFLLRESWPVFILRSWHQHQRLEKTVSFSEMYRFRYLLGLQHSKCTRVAWRVGQKWPISYYVSDNEHHSYSFWKSKSFYRLMLVDHSKEAENDQLSDGYSLDAPSGALRAPLLHSLTWSWKMCVKVTPKPSSRIFLLRQCWSVFILR